MEIHTGQNLFNILSKMCDFTALEDEMGAVIDAIKKDNPQLQKQVKNNDCIADVMLSLPDAERLDNIFDELFPKLTSCTASKWAKEGFLAGIKVHLNNEA